MAAEPADEGLRLIDMPPEIVQKVAFDSGVLSPADVGAMKKCCHGLRDLLGGGNAAGDAVALRRHGRISAEDAGKRPVQLLMEGKEIQALFSWGVLGRSPTKRRNRPLKMAAAYGHAAAVRYLLRQKGVDPSSGMCSIWRQENAALLYAASGGHTEVVRVLFESGRLRITIEAFYNFVCSLPGHDWPWSAPLSFDTESRWVALALFAGEIKAYRRHILHVLEQRDPWIAGWRKLLGALSILHNGHHYGDGGNTVSVHLKITTYQDRFEFLTEVEHENLLWLRANTKALIK